LSENNQADKSGGVEKPLSSAKKRVLAGKYILEREIARGAMGRVFLATQIALKRKVAVKVMVPKYGGPDFDKRFMLEAQSVAALSHPNIVTVHDYGQTESDLLFMAMEFLDGPTLGRYLANNGPFPVGRACNIVIQIARALRNAHAAGLVHRDLKPGNVILLVDDEGQDVAKVLDFGLAKVFETQREEEDPNAPLTRDGLMLGTPKYMAPEQIIGKEINPTTDLYSLGALFYHMLSGRPPFEGDNDVEVLHAQLKSSPTPVHEREGCEGIPPELSAFIERCMQREQSDRMQSAKEFISELRALVSKAIADPEYHSAFDIGGEVGLSPSVIAGTNSLGSSFTRLRSLCNRKKYSHQKLKVLQKTRLSTLQTRR